MKRENTEVGNESSPVIYEHLEKLVRSQVQRFIQQLLEEEVNDLLGRQKHERREGLSNPGYRNGYGKPRQLTLSCGAIEVKRPRVRGLAERFESRLLPLFAKRSQEMNELLPKLYLHGLAEGDFDLALRGLLGEEAPLSGSTVARLKASFQAEYEEWNSRSLNGQQVVYLWVDGVYVKAGLEKDKACVLVALGALADGRKVILSLKTGYRESKESWADFLRDLKKRGLTAPRLTIGDGHLGIWSALSEVYPESQEQRCWNHRIINVLDKVPKRKQTQAKLYLRQIPFAQTRAEADKMKAKFQKFCEQNGYAEAGKLLNRDWERMVTFYAFPKEHWCHLRTSNPIESPFAYLRLRTDAAKRYRKVENATAVIWKMLLIAEKRFNKLHACELLPNVLAGDRYVDGILTKDVNNLLRAA